MKKAADPVMADYAKEIGAEAIYSKINRCNRAEGPGARSDLAPAFFCDLAGKIGWGRNACANSSTATTAAQCAVGAAWPPDRTGTIQLTRVTPA